MSRGFVARRSAGSMPVGREDRSLRTSSRRRLPVLSRACAPKLGLVWACERVASLEAPRTPHRHSPPASAAARANRVVGVLKRDATGAVHEERDHARGKGRRQAHRPSQQDFVRWWGPSGGGYGHRLKGLTRVAARHKRFSGVVHVDPGRTESTRLARLGRYAPRGNLHALRRPLARGRPSLTPPPPVPTAVGCASLRS
jgi:hypothetical protein